MRVLAIAASAIALSLAFSSQTPQALLGKWNLTGLGEDTAYVYWLEVKDEGGRLSGMFLNRTSSPFALTDVRVSGNELVFVQGGRGGRPGITYTARLENGRLIGQHTLPAQGQGETATAPRLVRWIGTRPPAWRDVNANGAHTFGAPVSLFDGSSLEAWTVQHTDRPMNWEIVEGALTNGERANNLVSVRKFGDFKVEAEYKLGEKSNSGVYLRGRYELQLLDDVSDTTTRRDLAHMAIYGRTAPRVNASKPAGEWQTMTATIVGNRLSATLNGQVVHDNAVIDGITGGALDNDEAAPGPILIQGDHTKVWFRRVVVTPITRTGR
jgi:hypothetical protein